MRIKKEEIPVVMEGPGTIMRVLKGLGGYTLALHDVPKGTDFTPLLKGLKDDHCQCPHWGYLFEGKLKVIYQDGNEEIINAGDAFYIPSGHTAIVEEDMKFFELSPAKEYDEVFENIQKRMAELSA